MSFHGTITAPELLPAEIAAALKLQSDAVYAGRHPRQVRRPVEVWLEQLAADEVMPLSRVERRDYRAHLFLGRSTGGASQTGEQLAREADALVDALVDHLHAGSIPAAFITREPGLVALTAREDVADEEPDNGAAISVAVLISFRVRR